MRSIVLLASFTILPLSASTFYIDEIEINGFNARIRLTFEQSFNFSNRSIENSAENDLPVISKSDYLLLKSENSQWQEFVCWGDHYSTEYMRRLAVEKRLWHGPCLQVVQIGTRFKIIRRKQAALINSASEFYFEINAKPHDQQRPSLSRTFLFSQLEPIFPDLTVFYRKDGSIQQITFLEQIPRGLTFARHKNGSIVLIWREQ